METDYSAGWDHTLLKMARPDIYRVNAFRILGLPVTASPKQISSHIRKLDLAERYGDIEQVKGSFLPLDASRNGDARRQAQQRLLDPELRFIDELFWIWPLSLDCPDDGALAALVRNDPSHALSIWESHEAQGSEASVSTHNLAVLYHAMALDIEQLETEANLVSEQETERKRSYWQQAFERWRLLLNAEGFWQRVEQRIRELDDPRLTGDTAHRMREDLPKALLFINAMLAVEAAGNGDHKDSAFHLQVIEDSGFDDRIAQAAIQRAVAPTRERVRTMCVHTLEEVNDSPERGNELARDLIAHIGPLLETLDLFLTEGDSTRESIHDEVALHIRSCLIAFANHTGEWREALAVAEQSLSIAESQFVQERIGDDIETIGTNAQYLSCWFCGRDPHADCAITVMMYGNVERDQGFLQTQVRWQYLPVTVPRCTRCQSAHARSKGWRAGGTVAAFFLAVVVGIAANSFWAGIAVLGAVIAAAHGLAAGTFPDDSKPESYKNSFRLVEDMLAKGWKIGQRPSDVS